MREPAAYINDLIDTAPLSRLRPNEISSFSSLQHSKLIQSNQFMKNTMNVRNFYVL